MNRNSKTQNGAEFFEQARNFLTAHNDKEQYEVFPEQPGDTDKDPGTANNGPRTAWSSPITTWNVLEFSRYSPERS